VRFVFDVLDGIWDAETKVMGAPIPDGGGTNGGGDSAIDVYLLDKWQCVRRDRQCRETTYQDTGGGVGSALGIAHPADPRSGPAGARTASGYILLARGAGFGSKLADTIAHELFHVIQNAYNWEGKYGGAGGYYHWLTESSAEWAGWHFTHGDREGQAAWFDLFSGEPEIPLNITPSSADRRYKAWEWHLFREIDSGGDAFMAAAWGAVRGMKDHQAFDVALDGSYPFASHFRDFAVKNLNAELEGDPLAPRYGSVDDLLRGEVAVAVRKQLSGSPPGDIPTTWSERVPRLSASYAQVRLDEDVRQVRLDLSDFASSGDLDADLLVHLPSGWERRRLTLGETRFCRDRPEEDVSEMYLVLSNHAFLPTSQPIEGEVELQALQTGCQGGHGTVTISREKHGTYTSARNNPVQVDMLDTATITFDLAPDDVDGSSYTATHSSITWSYSLKAVETADGCSLVEGADGGGTWEADDGPSVLLGWGAPDGTLFGMVIDPERYVVNVTPPSQDMPDEDPRGWYQGNSTLCGGDIVKGLWLPYTTLAIVDGELPENPVSLSGSRTRTLEPFSTLDVPTTETVTWSVSLGP
jgi:hypothetical protein